MGFEFAVESTKLLLVIDTLKNTTHSTTINAVLERRLQNRKYLFIEADRNDICRFDTTTDLSCINSAVVVVCPIKPYGTVSNCCCIQRKSACFYHIITGRVPIPTHIIILLWYEPPTNGPRPFMLDGSFGSAFAAFC